MSDIPRPFPRPLPAPPPSEVKRPSVVPLPADLLRTANGTLARRNPDTITVPSPGTLTANAFPSIPASPREARRIEEIAKATANAWEHISRGVTARAEASNAAALTYKKGVELLAAAEVAREDAACRCALFLDDIAKIADEASIRTATLDARIQREIAAIHADRREREIAVQAIEERARHESSAYGGYVNQEKERNRLEMLAADRRSRTERERVQAEIDEKSSRAAYARHASPVGIGAATNEDMLDRIIRGLGTLSAREEMKTFFRDALNGNFFGHDLSPVVYYTALREAKVNKKSPEEAIDAAARTVLTFLERPRETWAKDLTNRYIELIADLQKAIDLEKRDLLRETLAKEEAMFSGTEPLKMPDF